jgi:hypothetical protein
MARREADREDLMREAAALVRRVEWEVPAEPAPVVAGLRRDGSLSVYFGADPVFHFDANAGLRRAFVAGSLWRTQGDTLARLTRVRTSDRTELARHDLTGDELAAFRAEMLGRLEHLSQCLERRQSQVVRQIPSDAEVTTDIAAALRRALTSEVWLAPRIAGKR